MKWSSTSESTQDFLQHLKDEYAVDKRCLAVLTEDDDWHPARITRHLSPDPAKAEASGGSATLRLEVEFLEFGKKQLVELEDVVLDEDIADDDGAGDGPAVCEMCERPMRLTFHHLTPRVTHAKYLKLGYSREYLNAGVMICRPCHSKIHSTESNKTLAREFNTLAKLLEHPEIVRWVSYARKQRVSFKPLKRRAWPAAR
ncbi:hypothetical protein ATCC90586_004466 [Pythium insidiosum]|nr:hypothetical protein ATCC90586_004466 [Pythium insidiosum]